jgi:lysosomal acid phosphatase
MYKYLIFPLFFIFCNPVFASEKLIFAIDLVRHGDRTPIHEIPNSPHVWEEGLGELTPLGMEQAYHLGVALRKKYIETMHLLPPEFSQETMYVRSTDMNRTLMTGISLLYGLYPLGTGPKLWRSTVPALPQGYQPIPIHTVPLRQDKLLYVDHKIYPPNFCQASIASFGEKVKHWQAVSGLKLNDCKSMLEFMDALKIRQIHHVPMPTGLSQQDVDEIVSNALFANVFKQPNPTGMLFVHTAGRYLQQAKTSSSPLRYILFVAHDSTILSVMRALGTPLNTPPPYVANVNFSLFQDGDNYRVKVFFNEKPVPIPACGGDCSLEQFASLNPNT